MHRSMAQVLFLLVLINLASLPLRSDAFEVQIHSILGEDPKPRYSDESQTLHSSSNSEDEEEEAEVSVEDTGDFGESLPSQPETSNEESNLIIPYESKRIKDFSAICGQNKIRITGQFHEKFKGRIYAFDYPDDFDCGTIANTHPSENITFELSYGQCGIQMSTFKEGSEMWKRYELSLYVQYSSFLQQIIDEKVFIYCTNNIPDEIPSKIEQIKVPANSRQGRKLKDDAGGVGSKSASKVGDSWMEIHSGKSPSPKTKSSPQIKVGEDMTLVVSTKVRRGYDARVVNCSAHDGSRGGNDGFRSQQILDGAGCTVDKLLVPNFRRRRLPTDESSRVMTLHFSTFPAFKFPERDHLHLKCTVAFCQGPCPRETCVNGKNYFGSWKEKYGRIADVLIDTADVVNSIQVIAPDLEDTQAGATYEKHPSGFGVAGASSTASSSSSSATSPSSGHSGGSPGREARTGESAAFSGRAYANSVPPPPPPVLPVFNPLRRSAPPPPPPPPRSEHYSRENTPVPQLGGGGGSHPSNNVCVSPGTVILALVIFGVIMIISATVTLWIALKRSEERKYQQYGQKHHSIFPPAAPSSYYRFSHW